MNFKKTGSVWPKGRGGVRPGAGRPPKRSQIKKLTIGQACEALWRDASQKAMESRKAALPHADRIRMFHNNAKAIPVEHRNGWLASENYEDHTLDLESLLRDRSKTPETSRASRLINLSTKPPKGTRQRIIMAVANQYGISEHATNHLWKAYRRFERNLSEYD